MTAEEARRKILYGMSLRERVALAEKGIIRRVLWAVGNNRTHAAQALGITRECLHMKIRRYGFEPIHGRKP